MTPTMGSCIRVALVVPVVLLILPTVGESQTVSPTGPALAPVPINGPAPPLPPDVIARDAQGRVTVRATRLGEPPVLDGQLDEKVYSSVPSFGDFIQQEPHQGRSATERTEVWVFFDDKNVYISARFWYSHPEDIIANEMRRDESGIIQRNDNIGVVLDTFYDHRSGVYLNTNPLGAIRDALLTNENRNGNVDYNLVWDTKSRRFEQGWTTEIAVPFKSLRYPGRREQVWGFNVQRIDKGKNEVSYLTPIPASYGLAGIWKLSSAATLVGIDAPVGGGRFEAKPYVLSTLVSDRQASPPVSNDLSAAVGFDAKYRISKSLDADFTYNTDFAQVEVDTQKVNLTRFNLFYPEKRDFFLEAQSIFNFGFTFGGARVGADPSPILFFSRQIGLTDSGKVPIVAGGRLTGQLGSYSVGVLGIRTKDAPEAQVPATTFSVVRVRRNVLGRSTIGVIATNRAPSLATSGANQVVGLDASLRFLQDLEVNAYYARSHTPGLEGDAASYLGQVRFAGDRYGAEIARLKVGGAFNSEIGFLSRHDFFRNYAFLRFSPRPSHLRGVRKISWEASLDDFTSTAGVRQTRVETATFRTIGDSGDEFHAVYAQTDDRPQAAFKVAGAVIAPGSYQFRGVTLNYTLGPRRPLVGTASIARGTFYGGNTTEVSYNGRIAMTSRFMVEPILTMTQLDLPQGSFSARLVSARTTYTMTPRMSLAALIQYNSTANGLGTNARFRWEYRPGSDVFVVYGDGRDTLVRGVSGLLNRFIAIKFTRLLRM